MSARYYHGGAPKMNPGAWLLPPTETGVQRAVELYPDVEAADGVRRRDRIYITSLKEAAWLFAALFPGGGGLYEVTVDLIALEADPDEIRTDDEPPVSFQIPRARIRKVLIPHLVLGDLDQRALARFIGPPE